MKHIRYSDLAVVPWKNGAGLRRDLASGRYAGPGSGAAPDSTWMIGIADLMQDAPFSSYPGVSRWFLPIGAGRLTLNFKVGAKVRPVHLNGMSSAHHFAGEDELHMVLRDGPMKALNVMTTGSVPRVTMERLHLAEARSLSLPENQPGVVSLLLLAKGKCRASAAEWRDDIGLFDSLVDDDSLGNDLVGDATHATTFEVEPSGPCEWVRVVLRWD
jgi:environmental stress-induced protein Ves